MKHLLILLSVITFLSCSNSKEKQQQELQARISRIENSIQPTLQIDGEEVPTYSIEDRLKALGIPGISIAVVNDGKVEWAKGYGVADSSANRMVDSLTMFLAGSISKPVSAIRAHQLVEEGKMSLDENINNYLTSWKVPDNEFTTKEKVTLRRILNHTAGLTVWGFPGYDKGDTIPTVVEVLDGKGNTDSVRVYKEPGESWMYSGGGYTIIQLAITDVDGMPFPETMQQHILDPLGMRESTFENPLPVAYHAIAATGYRGNGDEVEGKWPIYPEMAAAGLWTTPSQLIQYAIEIQKIHQTKTDGILKYETVEEMLTPGMSDHGLGPGIGEFTFGHGGADEGFRADLTAWKDTPNALVIMVNSDNGSIISEVKLAIAREYNLPGIEANIKKVVQLPTESLEKYTGKYKIEDLGELEIFELKGHLGAYADFIGDTIQLLAESDTLFFEKSDGTSFNFSIQGDSVMGFEVDRFTAERVE
ncbi:MAG TPA: serine hydrolase [Bacteroidales bacterium]|jgi:CubicO group peptidase (beta-lactamase class C family)|nr:serine hydrolase [Bacteroidales bacterium]